MAHKNREKEYWLIPKRANLHQSVVLLNGIVELQYDGKAWNSSKQDRLGAYLGKNGATKKGRTISPQSLRTLLASIPQYFGFAFINFNTTPSTLFITKAGFELIKEFKEFLEEYDYFNLVEAEKDNGVINMSDVYLRQFLKLQITNPVILKDCENIQVFPLIYVLKALNKLQYLTYEEIAFFIFKSKAQDEIPLTILEIENFRKLGFTQQRKLIDAFKATHLGNISLVKAASTSYFQLLCSYTGLIKKSKRTFHNEDGSESLTLKVILLEKDQEENIDTILSAYDFETYDFENNLNLWLQYIGNPEILRTPKNKTVINEGSVEQLIIVLQEDLLIAGDLVFPNDKISFPVLENYVYNICIYSKETGKILKQFRQSYSDEDIISIQEVDSTSLFRISKNDIAESIIQHIQKKDFSTDYAQYLKVISSITEKDLVNSKNLRGARLEFLFFEYFQYFENHNLIDEVIWNGKIKKYGIPSPSPGGPKGDPDLLIFLDDVLLVCEVTTIKSKSQQWAAEGASVPDHIRLIKERYPLYKICALYLAPVIHHERVTKGMLSRLSETNINLHCLTIEEFLRKAENFKQRADIKDFLLDKNGNKGPSENKN